MDLHTLVAQMPSAVPMVGTLRIQFLEVGPQRVMLRLPDLPEYRNHLGGPHSGALFTLAETASAAIVLGNFGGRAERVVPLTVAASIRYRKVALGPMYAEAMLDRTPGSIIDQLHAGRRAEFDIAVAMAMEDWTVTGEATFRWVLKPTAADLPDPGQVAGPSPATARS